MTVENKQVLKYTLSSFQLSLCDLHLSRILLQENWLHIVPLPKKHS